MWLVLIEQLAKFQHSSKHFRIWCLVHKWGDKIPPALKSDTIEATGWIKRDKSLGGGEMGRRREKVFLGICSIWWREEEGKISRWNCLSYTRHVTYLNLICQTNASIKSVPGTSQPQRNITSEPRLDINYIMPRNNVRFFDALFPPILLYSSEVWGAYDRTDSKKLGKRPHWKNSHTFLQTFYWPK